MREGTKIMHPFYGPGSKFLGEGNIWWLGMASMLLYLLFWAVVIIFAGPFHSTFTPLIPEQNI